MLTKPTLDCDTENALSFTVVVEIKFDANNLTRRVETDVSDM